jgi:sec-independent protein translocase protein TatA
MGGLSIWHWLVVGVIILLLFGKGRFSEMMGDVAKGLKSFKKGMSEDEEAAAAAKAAEPPRRLSDESVVTPPVERSRDVDLDKRREP